MKRERLELIKEIIAERHVATQEELTALLLERGEKVTQATVSRDIKEMRLLKVHDGMGSYHYVCPKDNPMPVTSGQMQKTLHNSILEIVANDSIVVVHTLPGAANFVALTIDRANFEGIIGTIAGDDTVFLALRSPECKGIVLEKLKEFKN